MGKFAIHRTKGRKPTEKEVRTKRKKTQASKWRSENIKEIEIYLQKKPFRYYQGQINVDLGDGVNGEASHRPSVRPSTPLYQHLFAGTPRIRLRYTTCTYVRNVVDSVYIFSTGDEKNRHENSVTFFCFTMIFFLPPLPLLPTWSRVES